MVDRIMVTIKIPSFQLNKVPIPSLSEGFLSAKGNAPSRIPCGQMYLQKYGGITSYTSLKTRPRAMIKENRIPYLI